MSIKKHLILALLPVLAIVSCNQGTNSTQSGDSVSTETPAVSDGHNAQNSLDVEGTYLGTLPCADCKGIQTTITLKSDSSYTKTDEYLGKGDNTIKEEGKWFFLADGNTIELNNEKTTPLKFKVGENNLIQLDTAGNEITGSLAEHYILKKQANP